eukprot:2489400-Pyramimonas_sp.AAC.1
MAATIAPLEKPHHHGRPVPNTALRRGELEVIDVALARDARHSGAKAAKEPPPAVPAAAETSAEAPARL